MKNIGNLFKHQCYICKSPATYRVYHNECAATSTVCDEHKDYIGTFTNVAQIELPEADLTREVVKVISTFYH